MVVDMRGRPSCGTAERRITGHKRQPCASLRAVVYALALGVISWTRSRARGGGGGCRRATVSVSARGGRSFLQLSGRGLSSGPQVALTPSPSNGAGPAGESVAVAPFLQLYWWQSGPFLVASLLALGAGASSFRLSVCRAGGRGDGAQAPRSSSPGRRLAASSIAPVNPSAASRPAGLLAFGETGRNASAAAALLGAGPALSFEACSVRPHSVARFASTLAWMSGLPSISSPAGPWS